MKILSIEEKDNYLLVKYRGCFWLKKTAKVYKTGRHYLDTHVPAYCDENGNWIDESICGMISNKLKYVK